jgi:MFS transporter, ACS family, glucarate transporter
MNMAGQVGSFASSVAFGYLVTYFGGYNAPLFPMAALLLIRGKHCFPYLKDHGP